MPRSAATSLKVRTFCSAMMVARALLSGLGLPSCLPKQFCTPASSSTTRTAPPAITPVPSAAGRSITVAPPLRSWMRCVRVLAFLVSSTLMHSFFACAEAFCTALITSLALAQPMPTVPLPSPTTTTALKAICLPPFTTLVTRRTCTTRSSKPSSSFWGPLPLPRPPPCPANTTMRSARSAAGAMDAPNAGITAEPLMVTDARC
mmetsp:Transcript_2405/g.4020  ORF Transcript_2405/g.4020 Transcript_2405/m.4020 type:complete len:204 (+) Transcript_2405:369-980(+)